jgi:RNA polymerase sigma-70 factor (ECF subfamily)
LCGNLTAQCKKYRALYQLIFRIVTPGSEELHFGKTLIIFVLLYEEYVHIFPGLMAAAKSKPRAEEDDGSVVARIANGEDTALSTLYDRYAVLMYTLGMRILRSVQDSEDIVQEVFTQVWTRAGSYQPERGSVYTWLVTMMRKRTIDRLRTRGFKAAAQQIDVMNPALFGGAGTAGQESWVTGTLKKLDLEHQQVLALAYYEGFNQTEIAGRLNIPVASVKTRMRTALQRMRSLLQEKM